MSNVKVIAALMITMLIWGSSFAIVKMGLQEIPPLFFAFIRIFIASIFLTSIIFIKKESVQFINAIRKEWKYFIVLGIIGITLMNITQNFGQSYTSSALAGILQNINPFFILVLSVLFIREIISMNKIFGTIIGFIGMVIVVFAGQDIATIMSSQTFLGNALMIGSAICWAIYSVLTKNIIKKYSALYLIAISCTVGWIALFPIAFVFEDINSIYSLSLNSWSILIYLGVFSSGITYFLWNYALSKKDASEISVFVFLVPVIAIAIGALFMGEEITLYTLIGSVLIIFGIYLTEKK